LDPPASLLLGSSKGRQRRRKGGRRLTQLCTERSAAGVSSTAKFHKHGLITYCMHRALSKARGAGRPLFKKEPVVECWWLTSIILATREAEIRKIAIEATMGNSFSRPHLNQ
jgi:hypothetical protein